MIKDLVFILAFLISSINLISAQDQIEGALTNPKGSLQLEAFTSLGYYKINGSHARPWVAPNLLLRIGLKPFWELQLSNQQEFFKEISSGYQHQGIHDLSLASKFQLYNSESGNFAVGFLQSVLIPIGSSDFTSNKLGTSSSILINQNLSQRISLGYNASYNYHGSGKGDLAYAVAMNANLSKKIGVYVEGFGHFEELKDHFMNFNTGLNYFVNGSIQLDLSYGSGINYQNKYFLVRLAWMILQGKS